jgi:energy-coupling factor transporter ATP-binding protein EcfA2
VIDLSPRPLRETTRDLELFVDRAREIQIAQRALENHSNVLLSGPRGIGKSSLLSALARALRSDDIPVLSVNGRVARSPVEVLTLLRAQLGGDQRQVIAANDAGAIQAEFRELRSALREPWTVALVDEMPSAETAHALFGRLRDELWELPLGWAVAAEDRDRASYLEPPADAFWRREIRLSPLSIADAEELLRRRAGDTPFSGDDLDAIVAEAGGNPRLLLSFGYDVLVDGHEAERLIADRQDRERRRAALTEPARRLLAELEAGGPAGPSDEALLRKLGWSRSRASQVFGELQKAGLVRADEKPSKAGRRPRRVYALER